jgi:hypothetical protein
LALAKWHHFALPTLLIVILSWLLPCVLAQWGEKNIGTSLRQKVVFLAIAFTMLLFLIPQLLSSTVHLNTKYSFNYNEGWNAFHSARLANGLPLYQKVNQQSVVPVTYPPLSFLATSLISRIGISDLLAGRILSLLGFLGIAVIAFEIVHKVTSDRLAGMLSAIAWCSLIAVLGAPYLGTDDPQMLGLFVSLAAMYLFVRWARHLTIGRVAILALVASSALFVKHTLLAVPLAIAFAIIWEKRWREAVVYAAVGLGFCSCFLMVLMFLGGTGFTGNFFGFNFGAFNSAASFSQSLARALVFLLKDLAVLLLIPLIFVRRRPPVLFAYGTFSILVAIYIARGRHGVGLNLWFEVLFFACTVLGLAYAELSNHARRTWLYTLPALALLPLLIHPNAPLIALDWESLNRRTADYGAIVEKVQSVHGPVLSEDLLLVYLAGKQSNFDSYLVAQYIRSNQLPERAIVDPIKQQRFALIVCGINPESLQDLGAGDSLPGDQSVTERWTDNTLRAINANYKLESRYAEEFLYAPRHGRMTNGN